MRRRRHLMAVTAVFQFDVRPKRRAAPGFAADVVPRFRRTMPTAPRPSSGNLAETIRTFMRRAGFALSMGLTSVDRERCVRILGVMAAAALITSVLLLLGVVRTVDALEPATAPFAWDLRVADPGPGTGLYTSIAIDPGGAPWISYVNASDGTVRLAHRAGSMWSSEIIAGPGISFGETSVAISRNGTFHVSYFDPTKDAVEYAARGPTGWSLTRIDTGFAEGFDSLALDSSGRPAIVYVGFDGSLRYAFWNDTAWSVEIVDRTTVTCRYPDLAFDPLDRPQISYYGNGTLLYANKNRGGWSHTVVDSTPFAGWFSHIRVDSRGVVHIAYYASSNASLMYATGDATGWSLGLIDPAGDAGYDLSFVLDANDRAQVSYYARNAGVLRYAMETSQGWVRETVDDGGVVGWYTGIATDSAGLPHISYYDWSDDELRYAEGRVGFQVRSLAPEPIASTSAVLRGEVVALGTNARASLGFAFRAAGNATWSYVSAGNVTVAGAFSILVTGLTPDVNYEFRAVGSAGNETSQGATLTLRLSSAPRPSPPYALLAAVAAVMVALAVGTAYAAFRGRRRRLARPPGPGAH